MNIAHQSVLFMRHIGDHRVGREQAGCGSIGVRRIAGQKKILGEVQQAHVSPITGVIFLAMQQEIGRRLKPGPGCRC